MTSPYKRLSAAQVAKQNFTTHGMSSHELYPTCMGVYQRCYVQAAYSRDYDRYGGRGIQVHPAWRDSVKAFIDGIEAEIGPRPAGHTIDRIDNDGDYEPGNIRWASSAEQAGNQSRRGPHGGRDCLCEHDCVEHGDCHWYDVLRVELGERHEGSLRPLAGRSG